MQRVVTVYLETSHSCHRLNSSRDDCGSTQRPGVLRLDAALHPSGRETFGIQHQMENLYEAGYRHYGGSGDVWQGRFKPRPIQGDEHDCPVLGDEYRERSEWNSIPVEITELLPEGFFTWSGISAGLTGTEWQFAIWNANYEPARGVSARTGRRFAADSDE